MEAEDFPLPAGSGERCDLTPESGPLSHRIGLLGHPGIDREALEERVGVLLPHLLEFRVTMQVAPLEILDRPPARVDDPQGKPQVRVFLFEGRELPGAWI